MIRIYKSADVPLSLRGLLPPRDGSEVDARLCGGKDVKEQLWADQHGKCAYCECLLNGDMGHIEHFRPKAGFTSRAYARLRRPGYYWLAYEWENLLLSCAKCNSVYKRNKFELRRERTRDIEHRDISREEPLMIDPTRENPEEFIAYEGFVAQPRLRGGKASDKGRYTIETLGLNRRADLLEHRRRKWEKHEDLERIAQLAERELEGDPENKTLRVIRGMARRMLEEMASPEAEYSAMFRSQRGCVS